MGLVWGSQIKKKKTGKSRGIYKIRDGQENLKITIHGASSRGGQCNVGQVLIQRKGRRLGSERQPCRRGGIGKVPGGEAAGGVMKYLPKNADGEASTSTTGVACDLYSEGYRGETGTEQPGRDKDRPYLNCSKPDAGDEKPNKH